MDEHKTIDLLFDDTEGDIRESRLFCCYLNCLRRPSPKRLPAFPEITKHEFCGGIDNRSTTAIAKIAHIDAGNRIH